MKKIPLPIHAALVVMIGLVAGPVGAASGDIGDIRLPDGFRLEVFAEDLPNARSMTLGKDSLFVGTRTKGNLYAVTISTGADGEIVAGERRTLASGLYMPNGVAFRNGDLFVAEVKRILRFPDIESRLDRPEYTVVTDAFPSVRAHGWKYIAFGPDDKLYVPIGAPCNVCTEPGYSVITRMDPDGSNLDHRFSFPPQPGARFTPGSR